MQSIILGGGCFWCTQAVFSQLKGVNQVMAGYMGGNADTANYQAVCQGDSGHIEVICIEFDPDKISLSVLLDIFFSTHDPSTYNQQGHDIGRQYASVIFYNNIDDVAVIQQKIQQLQNDGVNVVTEVYPVSTFYPAEDYHQDFYQKNPHQSYCYFVIAPKLAKLRQKFSTFLNT